MADAPLITSEEFDTLEAEWAALWARVGDATPFQHPAWYRVWLRHFGSGASPVFLSIRRGEHLVGVAALDMDREEARQLGDHNVQDYAGPLALGGEEGPVAAGVLEWLREDLTPGAVFWGLAKDSPMRDALAEAAEAGGWESSESHEAVCPGVDLPGDFEAFVGGLSKHDRHELRRKMRNFEAAGAVEFTSLAQASAVAGEMDTLFRLMRASRGDKDEFLTPVMEAFFRDLATTFAGLGMLRLAKLRLDGVTVAMTLSFEHAGTTFLYNSGYDPEFSRLAVGLVSKASAIRESIERGGKRFDFLRGDEEYKRRLGGVDREVVTMRLRAG
ncbi:MAG: GNAT family N-acetyltransferase [Dehalococcoidia bacterium]|uniref:GNAT family N-acetyltransferase n=1 Tax=Candidatus Amarobacter glycogenicus TaxID=3140699 RepID=UPI00313673EA|nr:GNAT family N-acetyltransferase [Dehalococcoidia bacterium]